MKLAASAPLVLSLVLGLGACNEAPDVQVRETGSGDAAAVPAATTGTDDATSAQQAQTNELPPTASPLVLIGGLGLLSLAGAAAIRLMRHR